MTQTPCSVAHHEALKSDETRWQMLHYVGLQLIDADDEGPAEALELRNCECGSTLCRTKR